MPAPAQRQRSVIVNVGSLFPVITPPVQRHRPGRHPKPARAVGITPLGDSRPAGSGLAGLIVALAVTAVAAIWLSLAAYRRRRAP